MDRVDGSKFVECVFGVPCPSFLWFHLGLVE